MVEPLRTIGNHGIVGDLETAALVALDATIDYLCWPSLESPTIFADLLHPGAGGAFTLQPRLDGAHHVQLYVPDTNVLITRWMSEQGSAEVIDLMPHPDAQQGRDPVARGLMRQVTVTRGVVEFDVSCKPRFDYAREVPSVSVVQGGVRFVGRELTLRLCSSAALTPGAGSADARFTLATGESAWFVLGEDASPPPGPRTVADQIVATTKAWRAWLARATYKGRWREQVMRSALTLKLLTSARHGSVAAAATFSLPEASGAGRNWDYRATWIRDASFTVYAFMRLGFIDEAEHFRR